MADNFLDPARSALLERLVGHDFVKSVSLRIKDRGNIVIAGHDAEISDARADCAILSDQATLEKILAGNLHPMKAILTGKMKVTGDVGTAAKFGSLFH